MKFSNIWKKRIGILLLACILFSSFVSGNPIESYAKNNISKEEFDEISSSYMTAEGSQSYKEYMEIYEDVRPEQVIEMQANEFVYYEDENGNSPEIYVDYEGMPGESVLTSETGLIVYEIQVEEEGFYDMEILYFPINGKHSVIQRSIFVDGSLPYTEAALIEFYRVWGMDIEESHVDENGIYEMNWRLDANGNDLRPSMVEKPEWISKNLYDNQGYITTPLSFYLTEGSHTISISSLLEPMLIHKITLKNTSKVMSYDQVMQEEKEKGYTNTEGQMIRIEAESATKTSSQMLYAKQDQSSPAVYPSSPKLLLNNTIGGNSWRLNGQWIEWEYEVEESGYYNISLFEKQNFVKGIYVSRRISIDGRVPFEEMEDYGFTYNATWKNEVLADENGDPYRFYLEEGSHTIRMEVVLGEFSEIISDVEECVQELNSIYRSVIRITGVSPDQFRDYQIETSLPELTSELDAVEKKLDATILDLQSLIGENSDKESVLITMRDQLGELSDDPERFAEVIGAYKINVRATANWITDVIDQPLQLDSIYIYSPTDNVEIEGQGFFARLFYEIKRLFYSFIINYNQLGETTETHLTQEEAITLWIGTGRDQANIIKALIDTSFTTETGVKVNVQLVDMNTLLRATLAGEGPDVAIQVPNTNGIAGAVLVTSNDSAVNYGIRNAVLDLSEFSDYAEVATRFEESALLQQQFDGATYGLPETQTFPMMFYREDILAELDLQVPQTWDEVKVVMSVLAKNQMEFGMLPNEQTFAMILYQNGGQYYTEDGSTSALDSEEAINAFKDYCIYYTDYKLDKETSVEERFRTGECPIIISDYTLYNNLQVSAPDIDGLWGIAPVPGNENEDGVIDRSVGSTGLSSLIMSDTENPEACWEFIKWWTSSQTQVDFGYEMESLLGEAGRIPTANIEAFSQLPWQVDDMKALLEQYKWVEGIPQVPGGYYTWRNVNNAFYTVTTDTDIASPREELVDKVTLINAELIYKWEEFGLIEK